MTDTEDDDFDADVCQHCGRFFVWTKRHKELAKESGWNPQRCIRCIVDECWIEEETHAE